MKLCLPAMANNHRRARSSLSLRLLVFFLLLHHLCFLDAAHAHSFDFPTGGLSPGWRSTPSKDHVVNFGEWYQVRSPLLRRSREGFGPTYACGFYCEGWKGCDSFHFSIFIVRTNSSGDIDLSGNGSPQVVWTANRGFPVGEKATLQLGSDGDLVLTEQDGTKVWSTNTSGESVAGMNLTEYGNLVLFGGDRNETIWDSFAYPTDSLVPGQKLWVGQSLRANTYYNNWTEGPYYLSATPRGLIAVSTPDNRIRYPCFLSESTGKIEYFVFMNGTISTSSSGEYLPPSQFLQLGRGGFLWVIEWNSTSSDEGWVVSKDLSDSIANSYCAFGLYPTVGLRTGWTSTPMKEDAVSFTDGSQVRSLLLRRSREGSGPTYACGFYCRERPCNSFLFSIFIVFTDDYGNITVLVNRLPQVVWVANRGHPVGENATLQLGSDGDIVLTDSDGTKVWSPTNTVGKSVAGINLTEYGNLVLFGDGMYETIWDSFSSPTDTLVPGQKLWVKLSLTANTDSTNWSEGEYHLYAASTELIAFVGFNPPVRYSSLLVYSTGEQEIGYFQFMNGSISTSSSGQQYMPPTQFLRLEYDGHLRVHEWNAMNASWNVVHDLITAHSYKAFCFFPTVCGRYGICSEKEQNCSCPHWDGSGSNYFVPVDDGNPRLGCKEVTPLSCQSPYNHALLRLDNISYFSYLRQPADIVPTDEGRCRDACKKNCSCKAAFFSYWEGGSSGACYLAYEVFSLKNDQDERIHEYGSTAFIKVQIPATSANSGSTDPTSSATEPGAGTPKAVILGSISGALFLLILVVCSFILRARKKILEKRGMAAEDEEDDMEQVTGVPRRFSLQELITATDDFSKKVGQGGFGSVYEGRIDGTTVAVKRLDGVGQGRKEFLAEVQTIGKTHHVNIVKLVGYCAEKSFRLLVYEFMTNGSLDRWIFSRDQKACLDWQTRCKIIFGVAKGLSYLHEECSQRIAHLDIKPQNILLDNRFDAKISDFGLAKLIDRDQTHVETRMRGTRGYMAPEWLSSKITEKVDVYSFGVVVLEIICGRRNLDRSQPEEDAMLVSLLKRIARDGELLDLVDESIKNTDLHAEEVTKMIKMTMWCLQDQNKRPSMSMVVKILEGALDVEYSDLEDVFWATSSVEECNGVDAGSSAPVFASVLSGPR